MGGDLASVHSRADRTDDGRLIINGFKRWCTGADFADTIYCLVRSGAESARHRNLSFVLIPTDTPGVTVHPIEHGNLRYTLSSDVILEDVELTTDHIVGGEAGWNEGWGMLAGRALDVEKLEITAVTFGIAQAAVEVLRSRNDAYFPQVGSAPAAVTVLDTPVVVAAPPPLTNRFAPFIRIGLGLIVGLALAFLAHYLDPTLRHREEVEALGLHVVGTLPHK